MKKQQNGASNVMMKRPAQICQIPATMHKGVIVMQHQKPKKTAAEMKHGREQVKFGFEPVDVKKIRDNNEKVNPTSATDGASAFSSPLQIPGESSLIFTSSSRSEIWEEILHCRKAIKEIMKQNWKCRTICVTFNELCVTQNHRVARYGTICQKVTAKSFTYK